jgi:C4-type Zn-finger protein
MSGSESEAEIKYEEPPTAVIDAPSNYEQFHELENCPLCNRPDPNLHTHMPVREFGYFDINLYVCNTLCECRFGSKTDPITNMTEIRPHKHKFSVKHEILTDAKHLKIYDRTHVNGVW